MSKLKKLLSVLLVAGLLLWTYPAYAQARYGHQIASCSSHTASLITGPIWVYRIKIAATSSNAQMGVYNTATLAGCTVGTTGTLKDEVFEATQYDSNETPYPTPIYFSTAVSVLVAGGTAFVEYGPGP